MKKIGLTFLAVLIMMSGVSLASAQDAVSPEKAALIKELFEATGGRQSFNDIMLSMISSERQESKIMIDKLTGDFEMGTPAQNAEFAKIVNESIERIMSRAHEFFEK